MTSTNQQQIETYQQGAAECRALQLQQQAAGNTDVARLAAEGVDANLDRINELNGQQ
ncbi:MULTISPECIES: hypothetical protein [Streptomyces]|uniref:Uncharacterized protein n=2 Tax=Streptomyces TaxID=1883 RepID=A0ABV9IQK6_9ACTN